MHENAETAPTGLTEAAIQTIELCGLGYTADSADVLAAIEEAKKSKGGD